MHSDFDLKHARDEPRHDAARVGERLRDLPCDLAAPFDWAEFRRRTLPRSGRGRYPVGWRHAALAALVAGCVATVALWGRGSRLGDTAIATAGSVAAVLPSEPRQYPPLPVASTAAAERWLAGLPPPPIVRVGTRAAAAGLEDRIAWMDDAISQEGLDGARPDGVLALRAARAQLVESLVAVRYAEALDSALP